METGETHSNELLNNSSHHHPLSAIPRCFLCQKDLRSLGEVEIYFHVNSCLDSSENMTCLMTTGEFPLTKTSNASYQFEASPGYSKNDPNSSTLLDKACLDDETSEFSCRATSAKMSFSPNGNRTLMTVVNEHNHIPEEDFVTNFPPFKRCSTIQTARKSKPIKSDLVEDEEMLQTALVVSATLAKTNIEIASLDMKERARRSSTNDRPILNIPWKHERERTLDERVLQALQFEQGVQITNEQDLSLERRKILGQSDDEIPFSLWRLTKGDGSNEDYLSEWMKNSDWKTEKPFDMDPPINVLALPSNSIELEIGSFPDTSRYLENASSLGAS